MDYRAIARQICQEEKLTPELTEILCACIEVESGYNPHALHMNIDKSGNISSIDFGIVQINDHFQIGPGLPFPNAEYVLNNPKTCIEWMARMFGYGKMNLWASYTSGAYKKYLPKVVTPKKT